MTPRLRRAPLLVAVTASLGLAMLHLRDVVFGGARLFERDVHSLWVPQIEFFAQTVAKGAWPIWNPGICFGQPFASDPSAHVFYPPAWIGLFVAARAYPTWYAVLHLTWGGVGAWLLARRLGISVPAGLAAASLWLLSGPLLSTVNLWHHLAGASWMPWVLFAAERVLRGRRRGDAVGFGLAFAGQVMAGSADMCAMTCALLLLRCLAARRLRALALLGAGGALAAGLAAPVWLPAAAQVLVSARAALPAEMSGRWSLHPATLGDLLFLPLQSWRLPLPATAREALFDGREPFLASVYLGAGTLPLVAAGLLGSRRRLAAALVALALTGTLFAMGRHTPLYGFAIELLPALRTFRYPSKLMVAVALLWSLAAGLGVDAWRLPQDASGSWRRLQLAGTAGAALLAVAGCAAFAWPAWSDGGALPLLGALRPAAGDDWAAAVGSAGLVTCLACAAVLALALLRAARLRWLGLVVAAFAVSDLGWAQRDLQDTVNDAFYDYRPAVLGALDTATGRVYVEDYQYVRSGADATSGHAAPAAPHAAQPRLSPALTVALLARSHLVPAIGTLWGLEYGFDSDQRGLYRAELKALVDLFHAVGEEAARVRLLRLGGVSHVVTFDDAVAPGLDPAGLYEAFGDTPLRAYRVPDPLPRTWVVGGTRIAAGQAALQTLLSPDFQPEREVLLPDGVARVAPPGFSGRSRVSERGNRRLQLEVELSHDGLVVLSESFDPGWKASVDGAPADLLRANVAFRAVKVPAGRHLVEMVYRPAPLLAGLALCAVSLAGLLLTARWAPPRPAGPVPEG